MKAERYIEILHEYTGISEVDIENDEEIGALSALTAMQRAVDEETATLRAELERLREYEKNLNTNWLNCCNDLEKQIKYLEVQLSERTEQLEGAFQLHRSLEWKLNAANKRISDLEKPVVIFGEPLRGHKSDCMIEVYKNPTTSGGAMIPTCTCGLDTPANG